jgi:hypothetical protein
MNSTQIIRRLERMVSKDLPSLENLLILRHDNKYALFNRYVIEEIREDYHVWRSATYAGVFHNRRSAVAWVLSDRANSDELCRKIMNLDREKFNLDNNIMRYQHVARNTKDFAREEILQLRLINDRATVKQVNLELNKCIDRAKYFQIQGFNNETVRTISTTPNRANRQGI